MLTADEIVEGCGGTSALAATLNLTPSTVSSWREVNFIPRWWHSHILEAPKKDGFGLTLEDFPPKSARRARKASLMIPDHGADDAISDETAATGQADVMSGEVAA